MTPTEKYLESLCRRTFLRLWSFPRLFNDEGITRNGGQGKELCDLLVVFGANIIIFSDKHCAFPSSGDERLDWCRWFKRAVVKSADQIFGAEKWLKRHASRIYCDSRCQERFPLPLPPAAEMKIHRIVVAHGVSQRCRNHFGASGTLMIDSTLNGSDHYGNPAAVRPFTVGNVDRTKGFVHVLDDESLDIVMQNRDTIADFVSYLEKKEEFLGSKSVLAAGEEELLALYMGSVDSTGTHGFRFPQECDGVHVDVGHWAAFCANPRRVAQLAEDKVSYAWDAIIEKFTYHVVGGTQYYSSHPGEPYGIELALRKMAAETRFRRRVLAEALMSLMLKAENHRGRANRIILPSSGDQPLYVFLTLWEPPDRSNEDYRVARRNLLESCCLAAKAKFPNTTDIVGIATEPGINPSVSEDLMYLDASDFTPEQMIEASRVAREMGLFQNLQKFHSHAEEYPRPRRSIRMPRAKIGRNEPCPCGSGLKYKKCCLE